MKGNLHCGIQSTSKHLISRWIRFWAKEEEEETSSQILLERKWNCAPAACQQLQNMHICVQCLLICGNNSVTIIPLAHSIPASFHISFISSRVINSDQFAQITCRRGTFFFSAVIFSNSNKLLKDVEFRWFAIFIGGQHMLVHALIVVNWMAINSLA